VVTNASSYWRVDLSYTTSEIWVLIPGLIKGNPWVFIGGRYLGGGVG